MNQPAENPVATDDPDTSAEPVEPTDDPDTSAEPVEPTDDPDTSAEPIDPVEPTAITEEPAQPDNRRWTLEKRKSVGRILNGAISLVLVFVAFGIAYVTIDRASSAGTLTDWGAASGLAVATMAVGAARAIVSMFPGGRKRIWGWALALLISAGYSLIFIHIGGVKGTSFALVLAVFVGPIVQDAFDE